MEENDMTSLGDALFVVATLFGIVVIGLLIAALVKYLKS